MKKIIIAMAMVATMFTSVFAAENNIIEAGDEYSINKNEVYVSYGTPSFINIFSTVFVAIGKGLGGETITDEETSFGSIAAGYNYYFNEHFALGAYGTYENFFGSPFFTLQAKLTAQYGWEHFKFYHSASFGGSLSNGQLGYAFDITPLGLKLDFNDFSAFAEVAAPITAMVKAGVSYKF